jgi:phospholipid transport system substrate-binding protein
MLRAAAAAVFLATAGWAAAPAGAAAAQSASALVQNLGGEVLAILKSGTPEDQRRSKFRELFAKRFAVAEMAQFSLGHHWRNINDQQRKEYVEIFRDYVASIYANRFAGYSGEQFKVVDERADANDSRQVSAEIVQPKGNNTALAFRVTHADGDFRIVDVKVEGVSLLVTKRSEFNSMIQRKGFAAFLDELKRIASTG